MSQHSTDRLPSASHKTLAYNNKRDAQIYNKGKPAGVPRNGETKWINEDGQPCEIVGVHGAWKMKPSPQSTPPFLTPAFAAG